MEPTVEPVIEKWLETNCTQLFGAPPAKVTPLAGDASARAYYRVTMATGAPVPSALLMEFPAGLKPLGSEEATEGACPILELPFLNVARHLDRAGIPVPKIYHAEVGEGLLLLEDLGNTHLFDVVSIPESHERGVELFGEAIDVMARMHEKASERDRRDDCTAFYQRMSEKLFVWEFEHFIEYGFEVPAGEKFEGEESERARALFAKISRELTALPTVFTHRDYHSQNILVADGHVVLIDFQDALLGPSVYDLASLLRDRYFGLTEDEVDGFLRRYLEERPECVEAKLEFSAFRRLFDLQVLQRNMKAAGRFVYIDRVKGKSHLLVHLPNLFASMERIVAAREELAPVSSLVARARGACLK